MYIAFPDTVSSLAVKLPRDLVSAFLPEQVVSRYFLLKSSTSAYFNLLNIGRFRFLLTNIVFCGNKVNILYFFVAVLTILLISPQPIKISAIRGEKQGTFWFLLTFQCKKYHVLLQTTIIYRFVTWWIFISSQYQFTPISAIVKGFSLLCLDRTDFSQNF